MSLSNCLKCSYNAKMHVHVPTILQFYKETQTQDIVIMAMWVLGGLLSYQNDKIQNIKTQKHDLLVVVVRAPL